LCSFVLWDELERERERGIKIYYEYEKAIMVIVMMTMMVASAENAVVLLDCWTILILKGIGVETHLYEMKKNVMLRMIY